MDAAIKLSTHQQREEFAPPKLMGLRPPLVHPERDGSRVIPKERTKSVFEEIIMLYVYRGVKYRVVDGKRVRVS